MPMKLSPEKLAEYRRGALARQAQPARDDARRRDRAWTVARQAADLLKREYGARRVWVFGSLLHPEDFGPHSDVDLAVEGMGWPAYFRAWAAIEGLTREFRIDLVDLETVSPRFRQRLAAEGMSL